MNNKIVVFFSATGRTKEVAEKLGTVLQCDTFEIKPKIKYTDADLNWMDKNSRSSKEMGDKSFRPALADINIDISNYSTIFLGFPIWWYVAPTIINSFLENYDFANKTIILFATSGGSDFGKTLDGLKCSVSKSAKLIQWKLIDADSSLDKIKLLAKELNL